jgi:hypothetical protein
MRAAWSSPPAIEGSLGACQIKQLQWQGHPERCQHRLSACESFVRSRMPVVPYELCRNMPKINPQHMHDYPILLRRTVIEIVCKMQHSVKRLFPL